MKNALQLQELDDALAFWKDATRQYWGSLCDKNATPEAREGFRRYYERARGGLAKAFKAAS